MLAEPAAEAAVLEAAAEEAVEAAVELAEPPHAVMAAVAPTTAEPSGKSRREIFHNCVLLHSYHSNFTGAFIARTWISCLYYNRLRRGLQENKSTRI